MSLTSTALCADAEPRFDSEEPSDGISLQAVPTAAHAIAATRPRRVGHLHARPDRVIFGVASVRDPSIDKGRDGRRETRDPRGRRRRTAIARAWVTHILVDGAKRTGDWMEKSFRETREAPGAFSRPKVDQTIRRVGTADAQSVARRDHMLASPVPACSGAHVARMRADEAIIDSSSRTTKPTKRRLQMSTIRYR